MLRSLLGALLTWGTLLLASPLAYGQDAPTLPTVTTIDELLHKPGGIRYLDAHQVTLPTAQGAGYYDVLQRLDSAGLDWHLRRYSLLPKQLVLEQFFTGALPQQILEGPSREWYASGQLREQVRYHKNGVIDTLRTYYPSGQPRRVQVFNRKPSTSCYDSLGNPLSKCPPYHTFATLRGKNTYSGKFLNLVQQQYRQFLPPGYPMPAGQVVYFAFRIDATGIIQEPRILSPAAPELQAAIIRAIKQLPAFEPAAYEGQATEDVLDGFVRVN
jgi:hypothetical protein